MFHNKHELAAGTPSGIHRPPGGLYSSTYAHPPCPLTSKGAARVLGVSPRELSKTLARYAHVPGIVEKHGRKNLFYPENIELIRALRRKSAASNARFGTNSAPKAVQEDYEQFVSALRMKRKGARYA